MRDANQNHQSIKEKMDFALEHKKEDGVAVKSKIRVTKPEKNDGSLDERVIQAANQVARNLLAANTDSTAIDDDKIDAARFPERMLPTKSIVEAGALIVIFESFDTLNFVYAKPGQIFENRNGKFPHDEFIGKPFGSIVRSSNNRGYGYVHLLKPTVELWARSLPHRTQIVHELDASMIIHHLELRPNMIVCESGTGSGALSHAIMRTLAPQGKLFTYEFNELRVQKAREEFEDNGVSHLVEVTHRDVCGKDDKGGGFGLGSQKAHAVMLDLPEPWLAVPHAAYTLKRGGRIASYSPCVEQSQRCIVAMKKAGFHSIRTLEFRLREHYVDEVELWSPPKEKRPRLELNEMHHLAYIQNNDKKDSQDPTKNEASGSSETDATNTQVGESKEKQDSTVVQTTGASDSAGLIEEVKRKRLVCTRPFTNMRGHTAFLTFATAGNSVQPDPAQS